MKAELKNKLRNLLRILLFVSSLAILFFLLRSIGFDKVAEVFVKVGIGGMLVLACCEIAENGLDAFALYSSLPGRRNFVRIFASHGLGSLANYLIPWEFGELVKTGLIKEVVGTQNSIKGVVIWNYIYKLSKACSLVSMAVLSLFLHFFMPDEYYKFDKFLIVLLCTLFVFLSYFGVMIIIKLNISVKIVNVLKYLGKKNADELMEKAEKMDKDLNLFKKENPKDYRKIFWLQFFARYASFFTFFFCILFVGFNGYVLSTLLLLHCARNLGNYISALIPMKLGIGEGTGYVVFAFMGLPGAEGGLVSFVLRINAIIAMSLVSGLIIFKPKKSE